MGGQCSKEGCSNGLLPGSGRCVECKQSYCAICLGQGELDMRVFVWQQLDVLTTKYLPAEMWERLHDEVLALELKIVIHSLSPLRIKECWHCTKDERLRKFFANEIVYDERVMPEWSDSDP